MKTLRVAFFGTPRLSVPTLDALHKEFAVVGVISQPDKPTGKGRSIAASPVSAYAIEQALPLWRPTKLNDVDFARWYQHAAIDVIIVFAYGKILPQWVLDIPKFAAINIHASLLPYYRGASPIAASILAGDVETGISYMLMNSKMDQGDIILQTKIPMDSDETSESLSIKISQSASNDIVNVVRKFVAHELPPIAQDHSQATYTKLLFKEDGQIDFNHAPANLERMIRAYHSWPGVWGLFKGRRVKLLPNRRIQMEGKKIATLDDFKHGYPDFPLNPHDH